MVNNNSDDLISKLSKLSERERAFLRLVCQGRDYRTITKELFISMAAVKQYMGRIYMKLELDLFETRAERMKTIYEIYCPLLKRLETESETVEVLPEEVVTGEVVETPEPVPPEVEKMVDEDAYPLVLVTPEYTRSSVPIRTQRENKPRGPSWLWVGLVLGLVLGICISAAIVIRFIWPNFSAGQPTSIAQAPVVEVTRLVTQPTASEMPIQTPAIIQQVIVVTATQSPATTTPNLAPIPIMSLPFTDNFDMGPRSEWQTVVGTWRMVDGMYGADEYNNHWSYIMTGDKTWQDYAVQLDVSVACFIGQSLSVLLRSIDPGEGIQFLADSSSMRWIILRDGKPNEVLVSGDSLTFSCRPDAWTTSRLRLEAKGNIFSAYLNGAFVFRMQDSTFSSGRVGLGTTTSSQNIRFDNFLVEAITP